MGVNYTLRQFLLGSIHTYMYVYVCRKEFKGEVLQTKLQKNVASHLYVYMYVYVRVSVQEGIQRRAPPNKTSKECGLTSIRVRVRVRIRV